MAVEIREKISDSHKGKKLSEKNKLRSSLSKRGIEHIYIKGKLFTSLRAAAKSLGHRYLMLYLLILIQETHYGKIVITLMTLIKTPVFTHLNLITCTSAGFQ